MIIQLSILFLLLLVVPVIVGELFIRVDGLAENILFHWVSGQFLLWAGFQLICVPLILQERSFGYLVKLFSGYMAACVLLAAAARIRRPLRHGEGRTAVRTGHLLKWGKSHTAAQAGHSLKQGEGSGRTAAQTGHPLNLREACFRAAGCGGKNRGTVLWLFFWGVLLFQLAQAVKMSYGDTDDAYYVAVSTITQNADTMYQKLPYTGGATVLDARHGLAPFPIWIAFLARLSGMEAVIVAKVVVPVALIAMTYAVFYLVGRILFPEKGRRLALFLVFSEILVLFGNTSIYTVENFMIARSRQGKAALGSIVIPFLLLLLLLLLKKIQQKERISFLFCVLMGTVTVTGCLCSTLGALLVCLALGTAGLLAVLCYKRPGVLVPMALCCIPCLVYAYLYLVFD